MRMRKKKNTELRLSKCSELLLPKEIINCEKETVLEIGCGKGSFICEMAKREPDVLFIAMEKVPDVAMLAAENAKKNGLTNVRFIIADAKELVSYFTPASLSRIYLNFSDPWTRNSQYKRRLTYRSFLEIYKYILKPNGAVYFKTDNRDLFDFSISEFEFSGFELKNITYDLHNSIFAENNIMTEYEKNFSSKGFAINRLEAYITDRAYIRIKKADPSRIDEIMPLFSDAVDYLAKNNIPQWQNGYPQKELISEDIKNGNAYVALFDNRTVGYCALFFGNDELYEVIEQGEWKNDEKYASVHRTVISEEYKGMGIGGKFVLEFEKISLEKGIHNLKIDTHELNRSMRRMIEKNGFEYCGIIHLEDGAPRVAYQKVF
ncbi:MAG: tRNA (guanosine(46)-N7)-methyltransferase TrmB [Clostridia bacterium]|nr:tRNA (guanosine(46)-N7)-methyltransferase TrmB [Clostridia bacterium]